MSAVRRDTLEFYRTGELPPGAAAVLTEDMVAAFEACRSCEPEAADQAIEGRDLAAEAGLTEVVAWHCSSCGYVGLTFTEDAAFSLAVWYSGGAICSSCRLEDEPT